MTPIDFVGVGAPKCGTTWLSTQLAAHPQIGFAAVKETYFFADTIARRLAGEELDCFQRGTDWYHDQFPSLDDHIRIRGEFCPSYLYSEEAAQRLFDYSPDLKLIFCHRPPVDMMYSWYWYNRNGVVARLPSTFAEAMKQETIRGLGLFARHLQPYLERFPRRNLLVVDFDAIRTEPDRVRQEVYRFLKVTPDYVPEPGTKGQNAARSSRFAWVQKAAHQVHAGLSRTPGTAQLLQSPRVTQSLEKAYHRLNSRQQKYPPLSNEERRHWTEFYRDDQLLLQRLLKDVPSVSHFSSPEKTTLPQSILAGS